MRGGIAINRTSSTRVIEMEHLDHRTNHCSSDPQGAAIAHRRNSASVEVRPGTTIRLMCSRLPNFTKLIPCAKDRFACSRLAIEPERPPLVTSAVVTEEKYQRVFKVAGRFQVL